MSNTLTSTLAESEVSLGCETLSTRDIDAQVDTHQKKLNGSSKKHKKDTPQNGIDDSISIIDTYVSRNDNIHYNFSNKYEGIVVPYLSTMYNRYVVDAFILRDEHSKKIAYAIINPVEQVFPPERELLIGGMLQEFNHDKRAFWSNGSVSRSDIAHLIDLTIQDSYLIDRNKKKLLIDLQNGVYKTDSKIEEYIDEIPL